MKQYWVSFILSTTKPWSCSITSSFSSLEKAMKEITFQREHQEVLSAWIDTFDENENKTTVFHECYLDSIGNLERIKTDES